MCGWFSSPPSDSLTTRGRAVKNPAGRIGEALSVRVVFLSPPPPADRKFKQSLYLPFSFFPSLKIPTCGEDGRWEKVTPRVPTLGSLFFSSSYFCSEGGGIAVQCSGGAVAECRTWRFAFLHFSLLRRGAHGR